MAPAQGVRCLRGVAGAAMKIDTRTIRPPQPAVTWAMTILTIQNRPDRGAGMTRACRMITACHKRAAPCRPARNPRMLALLERTSIAVLRIRPRLLGLARRSEGDRA